MVFKTLGTSLSNFINKSWTDTIKDFKVSGISSLVKDSDTIALQNFNQTVQKGIDSHTAYRNIMSDASETAKKQALSYIKCENDLKRYNAQLNSGKLTQEQYNTRVDATRAKMASLGVETEALTVKERVLNVVNKAVSVSFQLIKAVATTIAFNLIISGISYLVNGQKELREKIKQTADEAKQSSTEISNLYSKYIDLSQAVANGTGSKEDLTSATDELLKALGLEGVAVDELIKKYGSLENAISATTIESLKNAHNEIVANVDAYKDDLLKTGDSWDSSHWGNANYLDFSSQDKGEAVSVDEYNEILNIFDKIGNIKKDIDTHDSVNPLTNYYLGGDTKTVEGIVKNYETLVKLQDELVSKL